MTPATAKPTPPRLAALRAKIEGTDDAILGLIVKRAELARKIGAAKKRAGLPVLDPAREAQVVRRAASRARELGMPNEEVRTLFWQIIALCRAEQLPAKKKKATK
jgi:chorismate mutase